MPDFMRDARAALSFVISQQAYIEPIVYRTQYADIRYPSLIPVDTGAPEWIQSITYFSIDGVGQAQWFTGAAHDVPHAEVSKAVLGSTVAMAAIGYRWNAEELGKAQLYGMNLPVEKALYARRASEEFIDQVAMFGDAAKNFTGLVNNAAVTAGSAAATGTGSSTTWASKTPDNVLADINAALSGIYTGTLQIGMADTILIPYTQLLDISTRRIDAVNQTTILEWVLRNNIYTRTTNQPLNIQGVRGLETAGSGSTARMVAYRKAPEVVKMHMPMPYRFLPAWQVGPMIFEVPGIFRLGGVDVKQPKMFRYVDGI
jgi:hypothetical protein